MPMFLGSLQVRFEAKDADDALDQLEWIAHVIDRDCGVDEVEYDDDVEEDEEDE
jgi:hypothetical protein